MGMGIGFYMGMGGNGNGNGFMGMGGNGNRNSPSRYFDISNNLMTVMGMGIGNSGIGKKWEWE